MTTFLSPPPAPTFLAFHPQDNNLIAIGMEDSSIQIYNFRNHAVSSFNHFWGFLANYNMVSNVGICLMYFGSTDTGENKARGPSGKSNWTCILKRSEFTCIIWC